MEKQSEKQPVEDIITTREDGFGHQFKCTRDANNLSIEDVARELHLDKKMILAMESEDYTQLPEAAFVCGYIRNYARFLKIQPDPLIAYYKNNSGAMTLEPELKITTKRSAPRQPIFFSALSALAGPLLSLLILLALAAGGWQGWLYISQHYLNAAGTSTDNLVLPEGTEAETALPDDINNTEVLLLPELAEPEESQLPLPVETPLKEVPAVTESLSEIPPVTEILPEAEEAVVEETVLEATALEDKPLAEVDTQAEDVQTAEPVIQTGLGNPLVVEFSGDSWVSIKDADDNTLAVGLKKYPKVMHLNGKTPYQVFLGDATVVKISFKGKAFDHTKYINNKKMARFKVE